MKESRKIFLMKNVGLIVLFAIVYHSLPEGSFNKPMKLIDALYFSAVTHTTLGYGDFYPESNTAKALCSLHSFMMFFLITEEFIK